MAKDFINTIEEWFIGPKNDEVTLPRWLTLRVGNMAFALERIILVTLAFIATQFNDGFLGSIAWIIWLGLVGLIIWELFQTSVVGNPSSVHRPNGDSVLVPKWYIRLMTVTAAVLIVVLVL